MQPGHINIGAIPIMYALYIHIYIKWYIQYSHSNRVIKLSLTSGQHFTCARGAAVVPTGAGGAFAPIFPPPEVDPHSAVGLSRAGSGEQGRGAGPGGSGVLMRYRGKL